MVYGILRLINFAHGDVFMVGAFVGYYALVRSFRGDDAVATVGAPRDARPVDGRVRARSGIVIERLAYRPVRRAPSMTLLITAIGVSLLLENGGQLALRRRPEVLSVQLARTREFIVGSGPASPASSSRSSSSRSLLMIGLQFFILQTRDGQGDARGLVQPRRREAHGHLDGPRSSRSRSRSARRWRPPPACSSAMQIPKIDPLMGIMYGLKAFVAAVLGGIGNIPGAVLGGLLIGMAEVLVVGYLSLDVPRRDRVRRS